MEPVLHPKMPRPNGSLGCQAGGCQVTR